MDLEEAFAPYPYFRTFKSSDEQGIRTLLEENAMILDGFELVSERSPRFQAQLEYQADHFLTSVAEHEGEVLGLCSFSWGRRLVGGKPTIANYAADLRVKRDRRIVRDWRKCYPEVIRTLETEDRFGPSEWIYTGILGGNAQALQSLVANSKRESFHYHALADLSMVNVLFPFPWVKKWRGRLSIAGCLKRGDEVGEDRLREFLHSVNEGLFLGYFFDDSPGNEWDRRKVKWPGFDLSRFLVFTDPEGKILSCTLPWSPSQAKRLRLKKLDRISAYLFRLLRTLGVRVPTEGESIETLYLTHLVFSRELDRQPRAEIIRAYLDKVYGSGIARGFHVVSFPDDRGLNRERALSGYFRKATDVRLFLVSADRAPRKIPESDGIGFEMALA